MVYWEFFKLKLKCVAEYPGAFWMWILTKLVHHGADVCLIFLMVYRFKSILAWSAYEVLMLYAINMTAVSLSSFFFYHPFQRLTQHIRNGSFDEMLTKPVNPLIYLCCREFSHGFTAPTILGLGVIFFCLCKLGISLSAGNWIYLVMMLFGGALIHSALFMFSNIPVFWVVKADALGVLRWNLDAFISYPISIYNRVIQIILTFVVPFAFINYYPVQALLQKQDYLGFAPQLAYLTPVVGIALFAGAYAFFEAGIRNYKSTGS